MATTSRLDRRAVAPIDEQQLDRPAAVPVWGLSLGSLVLLAVIWWEK